MLISAGGGDFYDFPLLVYCNSYRAGDNNMIVGVSSGVEGKKEDRLIDCITSFGNYLPADFWRHSGKFGIFLMYLIGNRLDNICGESCVTHRISLAFVGRRGDRDWLARGIPVSAQDYRLPQAVLQQA